MVNDDNGAASPYPGPAGADSDEELLDEEDSSTDVEQGDGNETPATPPVDDDEEPSPGNAV